MTGLAPTDGARGPAGDDTVAGAARSPLPLDTTRVSSDSCAGEVVMTGEGRALPHVRGCVTRVGADMLFGQVRAGPEFVGLPNSAPDELRRLARTDSERAPRGTMP